MDRRFWQQLSFDIDGQRAQAATELLETLGALAVSSLPRDGEDRFDLAEPRLETWSLTRLSALFDEDADLVPVVDAASRTFELGADDFEIERFEDRDWEREWLERFSPVRITEKLWICPSWREPPDPDAINVILDPGLAFGTGTHPTTTLCLEALAGRDLEGRTVLDFGAGSGILAIAALRLGAARAIATDVDPRALDASLANARVNAVDERLEVIDAATAQERIASGRLRADVVVANILAEALVTLSGTLAQAMEAGGGLLLSGILDRQQREVRDAYPTLDLEVRSRDEWILLATR